MTKYTLGFAFDASAKRVVLIQKNRPAWQAGCLNGVGGHVEEGESAHACMAREFREKTGVDIYESNWKLYARLFNPKFEMHVFSYFGTEVNLCTTLTDEAVGLYFINEVQRYPCISNLKWLIPAALEQHTDCPGLLLDVEYGR